MLAQNGHQLPKTNDLLASAAFPYGAEVFAVAYCPDVFEPDVLGVCAIDTICPAIASDNPI